MNSTLKKVLSVVLCIVMVFSTAAFAFAADEDAITYGAKYFQKTSSTANNADIVLDKIDALLKEKGFKQEIDLKIDTLVIDFTSVNGLCSTLDTLKSLLPVLKAGGIILTIAGGIGDLQDFEMDSWKKGLKRGSNDTTIISNLIALIAENASLVGKIVNKSLNLGFIDGIAIKGKKVEDILKAIDIYSIVKKLLVGLVYKDENSAEYKAAMSKPLDNFVYNDVFALFNKEDGALPGFTMNSDSKIDNLLMSAFASCYKKYLVGLIQKINVETNGNASLEKIKEIVNLDGSTFTEDTVKFDKNGLFSTQINSILGDFVKFFLPKFTGWEDVSVNEISKNFTAVYRYLAGEFGITGETDEEIAVNVINRILKKLQESGALPELNDYVGGVDESMNLEAVITVVIKNAAKANNIPVTNKTNATYGQILGDMLTYAVEKYIDLGYTAGAGNDIWKVVNDIANVFLFDKGFAKAFNITGIAKADPIFKKIDKVIDMTKIFAGLTPAENYKSEKFIKELLECVFKFNIAKAIDMTAVTFLGDFGQKSAVRVLYDAVYNLLKSWADGKTDIIVPYATANPFDNAIQNSSLKVTVENLLKKLNEKKTALIPPVLYIAAMVLTDAKATIGKIADQTYTGKAVTPAVTVKMGNVTLKNGTDYTVAYSNNVELGKATAVITAKGQYKGTYTTTFNIVLAKVANLKAKASGTSAVLTWNAVPGATYQVTANGKTQTTTKNTITISGLKYDTKYTATVKAVRGSASNSASVSFATTPSVPAQVKGLKVTSKTASQVNVAWTAVSGATSYQVFYHDGKSWRSVTSTKNSASIAKLAANKTYQIKVRALKKGKNSSATAYGAYSAVVKAVTRLAAPASFKVISANNSTIKLSWGKVAGAASYKVFYSTDGKKWKSVTTTKNSATLSKLAANKVYYIKVQALSKTNSSAYSATLKPATAPSAKVTGLKVTSTTSNTVNLTWKAVSGATGYKVFYSTNGKSWKSVTVSKNKATLSKLAANKTYQIKVKVIKKSSAVTAEGTAYSAVVKATTKVAAPTGLKATKVTKNSVALKWNKVAGASGYVVYRNGKKVATIKKGSTVKFTDKKLKAKTTYKYKVVAYKVVAKKNVYGNYSSQISVKTKRF